MSLRAISILLASIVVLTHLHGVDVWISDLAYDFGTKSWLIDHTDSEWRTVLYDGPKALLILFALILIAMVIVPTKRAARLFSRREALFVIICLAVVPGVVGMIKQNSGVSCPYSIEHYGGSVANSLGEAHLSSIRNRTQVVGCWPSGHTSGGFALLALAFLGRSTNTRTTLALGSLTLGSAMGVYQVLRGAHFASHILLTLCIALLLIALVQRLLPPGAPYRNAPSPLSLKNFRPQFDGFSTTRTSN